MPRPCGGYHQHQFVMPKPIAQPLRPAGTAQAVAGAVGERLQHHPSLEHHHAIDFANAAPAHQVVRDISEPVAAAAVKYRNELQLIIGHAYAVNSEQHRDVGPAVAVDVADHGAPQCTLFVPMYAMRECRNPLIDGMICRDGRQCRQQHQA